MNLSYGPAGAHGVTRLMAVGDVQDDYATKTDRALKVGAGVSAVVLGLGLLSGSRTLRNVGVGAVLACLGVREAARPR